MVKVGEDNSAKGSERGLEVRSDDAKPQETEKMADQVGESAQKEGELNILEGEKIPRGRGRPLGSKNKIKTKEMGNPGGEGKEKKKALVKERDFMDDFLKMGDDKEVISPDGSESESEKEEETESEVGFKAVYKIQRTPEKKKPGSKKEDSLASKQMQKKGMSFFLNWDPEDDNSTYRVQKEKESDTAVPPEEKKEREGEKEMEEKSEEEMNAGTGKATTNNKKSLEKGTQTPSDWIKIIESKVAEVMEAMLETGREEMEAERRKMKSELLEEIKTISKVIYDEVDLERERLKSYLREELDEMRKEIKKSM